MPSALTRYGVLCRALGWEQAGLPPVTAAIYLIDTSGLFRILQGDYRQAWAEELAAGVVATCPVVELEFLYSARSLADRLEKKRLLRTVFGWVPMTDRAFERAEEVQQLLPRPASGRPAQWTCWSPPPRNGSA